MWENTAAIHSVLKKKIKKINSQLAQYLKKNRHREFQKKNLIRKRVKKTCWEHCSNSQYLVMKAIVLPHMI